jgi:hypothetical protein
VEGGSEQTALLVGGLLRVIYRIWVIWGVNSGLFVLFGLNITSVNGGRGTKCIFMFCPARPSGFDHGRAPKEPHFWHNAGGLADADTCNGPAEPNSAPTYGYTSLGVGCKRCCH